MFEAIYIIYNTILYMNQLILVSEPKTLTQSVYSQEVNNRGSVIKILLNSLSLSLSHQVICNLKTRGVVSLTLE